LSIAFNLLIVLCGLLPVTFFVPSPIAQSTIGFLTATLLAFIGASARSTDVEAFKRAMRFCQFLAVIPAIWIVFQLLPVPIGGAAIWASAGPALGRTIWSHVTVDIGDSISALWAYLALVALCATTVLLSVDRARAHTVLLALNVALFVSVLLLMCVQFWSRISPGSNGSVNFSDALAATSSLGLIISIAASSSGGGSSIRARTSHRIFTVASLTLCVTVLIWTYHLSTAFAAVAGLVVYALSKFTRRIGIPAWAVAAGILCIIFGGVAIISAWQEPAIGISSPWLRYTSNTANIDVAKRALGDAGALGTGAGSYRSLLPIYADLGTDITRPPNTAVALAVQLGWPFATLACLLVILLFGVFIQATLSRRRDAEYAATSAACLVGVLIEAFCDASLLNYPGIAAAITIIVGVGIAQGFRRSDNAN
jgi:hypothetical protein